MVCYYFFFSHLPNLYKVYNNNIYGNNTSNWIVKMLKYKYMYKRLTRFANNLDFPNIGSKPSFLLISPSGTVKETT